MKRWVLEIPSDGINQARMKRYATKADVLLARGCYHDSIAFRELADGRLDKGQADPYYGGVLDLSR